MTKQTTTNHITNKTPALPEPMFWHFSESMGNIPEIDKGLDALEKGCDFNRNFFLFCCWFAQSSKGRLSRQEIYRLLPSILTWDEGVVGGLRRIKALIDGHSNQPALAGIRELLLDDASLAERIGQLMLADEGELKLQTKTRTSGQRLSDACINIINYAHVLRIKLEDPDIENVTTILKTVFSQIRSDKVAATWCAALAKRKELQQFPRAQLAFKLE